jgi:hypothetical protein
MIVMRDWPQTHLMLSALVLYLNGNDPGTGFYALAQDLEMLPARVDGQAGTGLGHPARGPV